MVSSSSIAKDFGLTGQEMNCILVKRGILSGEPGAYELTAKGLQYGISKDFHAGTGGYQHYNRYWSTTHYNDDIRKILDITPELIAEVKKEVSDRRAAQNAVRALARAEAEAKFLAEQAAKKAAELAKEKEVQEALAHVAELKKYGKVGLIIAGVATTGFVIYKAAPKVKRRLAARTVLESNEVTEDTIIEETILR